MYWKAFLTMRRSSAIILSQAVLRKLWVSLKDLLPIILVIAFF
jgi:hypothetical protein